MKYAYKIYGLVAVVVFLTSCNVVKDLNGSAFQYPENYIYSSDVSNFNVQSEFPEAWDGQDYDYNAWNEKTHPDEVVLNLFKGRIFKTHYMKDNKIPVLVVDKIFYKLSGLDRRRMVKLFVDRANIFNKGYSIVQLVDGSSNDVIGSYTDKGLFLK